MEIAKRIIRSLQLTASISADVETVSLTPGVTEQRLPQEIEARAAKLLGEFISALETNLGPRRINFDAIAVKQSNGGPCFLVVGADATVFVGPNATKYEPALVANLAHESVHLLDATSGLASMLEEGLAVDFELSAVGRRYGTKEIENFERCLPRSYTQALNDYRRLLRLDSSAAFRIRQEFGSLTGPTATELRMLVPSLSRWLAYRLVRRIRMRPADEIMTDNRNALTHWNPGMRRGIIVTACLMAGLKLVDTLVQENGVLAPSCRWTLIAGLCGAVYGAVVNAYQAGLDSKRNQVQADSGNASQTTL